MGKEIKLHISKQMGLSLARLIYDTINQEAFYGTLPKIPIRIRKLGQLEHSFDYELGAVFTVEKEHVCFSTIIDGELKNHSHSEERISISVDSNILYLTDVSDFLINLTNYIHHEMVHEYCYLLGINNCDYVSQYHNTQFMLAAESHGLRCDYDEEYGFQQTFIHSDLLYRILDIVLGTCDVTEQIRDSTTAY